MLIKESEIMSSPLDDIQYIEQPISEATIPVTENSRLGKYVVSIEDISEFCEDTNNDPGYVISRICESNGIDVDNIAFSIKEESVILGENAANISVSLMNEGADVLAAPTTHDMLWQYIGEGIQEKFGIPLDEVSIRWVRKKLGDTTSDDSLIQDYKIDRATQADVDYYTGLYYKGKEGKEQLQKSYVSSDDEKNKYITGDKYDSRPNKNTGFIIKHGLGLLPMSGPYEVKKGKYELLRYHGTGDMYHNKAVIDSEWALRNKKLGRSMRGFHKGHVARERRAMEDKAWAEYNNENNKQAQLDKEFEKAEAERYENSIDVDTYTNIEKEEGLKELDRLNKQDDDRRRTVSTAGIKTDQKEKQRLEELNKKDKDKLDNIQKVAMKSNDKNFVARIIAKLHDWAKIYSDKYKQLKVTGPKTAIKRVIGYITQAIAALSKRLHNLTTKYKMD